MKDLGKINLTQLYNLWKNISIGILILIATICVSTILPYYLSPIIALALSAYLYYYIYNVRLEHKGACVMPVIAILYSVIGYAFITITLNLLHIWAIWDLPPEFVFFTNPFIPTLILNPVCFIVMSWIYIRHNKMKLCVECRLQRNMGGLRGAPGVLNNEYHLQLKTICITTGILTLIVWLYYWIFYIDVNLNARDTYIFTWSTIIGLLILESYFCFRYFNLYLDLKEGGEIITPLELNDMTSKTYLRFYVVCGDYLYVSTEANDPNIPGRKVIDTPFFTKQTMNGILAEEVKTTIERMTGVDSGELRFFYGRKSLEDSKHSLLRYFYFIDENPNGSLPELEIEGEWVPFDKIKYLYSHHPLKLAELAVYDITRLATIILTEKIFDERGYRKSKIKSYNPGFNLKDVRASHLDFQDDKWIEISILNSDVPLFKLKKWWHEKFGKVSKKWR